jgi:hypothetical protein
VAAISVTHIVMADVCFAVTNAVGNTLEARLGCALAKHHPAI